MKYLLPLALTLFGCAGTIPPPTILENPPPAPMQIALGSSVSNIAWTCTQQEVNPALVWIECVFNNQNKSLHFVKSSCIRVSYYDEATGKLVISSNQVCSGFLLPGESMMNYVAFQKDDRKKLDAACGTTLDRCVMLAGEDSE